jgi:hypothetical protein
LQFGPRRRGQVSKYCIFDRRTTYNGGKVVDFDYVLDAVGRVSAVSKTSAASGFFSRYSNGTQGLDIYYLYDSRSQVTAETTYLGGSTATVLTGRTEAYAYDQAGNRSTTTHNGSTATYNPSLLNQYDQRTVSGYYDVAGGGEPKGTCREGLLPKGDFSEAACDV